MEVITNGDIKADYIPETIITMFANVMRDRVDAMKHDEEVMKRFEEWKKKKGVNK